MPVSDAAILRYKRQIAGYRNRTSLVLTAAWDRLGTYTEDDIDRYARQTAPTLSGAKVAAVALSAAFFSLAVRSRPVGVRAGDIPVEARIRDPFLTAWHAVSEGRSWVEASAAGRSMAEAVGFNFVQSTARRTGDVVAERSGEQVRWRRVPGGSSCSWCLTVAGQLYHSAESADFGHDRCDCDAVPA